MNARDWLRKKLKVSANRAATEGGLFSGVLRRLAGLPRPRAEEPSADESPIVIQPPQVKRPAPLNPARPGQVRQRADP